MKKIYLSSEVIYDDLLDPRTVDCPAGTRDIAMYAFYTGEACSSSR